MQGKGREIMTELQRRLSAMAEADYRDFSSALVPGVKMLGVRLPALRKLAKEIASGDAIAFLEQDAPSDFFEETMLRGMVIGAMRAPLEARFYWIQDFVPRIDNWSVCDSFCASLRFTLRHKAEVWTFLEPYFTAPEPFAVRFAVVMALDYFLDEESIDRVLSTLRKVSHPHDYVQMAVAWCLATAVAKYPQKTLPLMQMGVWDDAVLRRAISKCCDSRRVPEKTKQQLKRLREKM